MMQRDPDWKSSRSAGVRTPPAPPSTFEEFFEWLDEETRAEWVEGEVVLMSPSNWPHQDLTLWLAALMRFFVDRHRLGKVVSAPFQIKLPGPQGSSREPDILFIAQENPGELRRTLFLGAPDLAVEVVSPDSVERDHVEKFNEYERAGVREYWVIDPDERRADFFVLNDEGHYLAVSTVSGWFTSVVFPGFSLNVEWFFCDPLPAVPEVLKAMGLI
ncbi:MAG: hypothetical protein FLDDKLPJ_01619 [Phycisphaerae bacterium]|nr:hypothetical protein [Phycisphaerae bacterium]